MSTDNKVVPIKRNTRADAIQTLKTIIESLENGEIGPLDTGCLILLSADATLKTVSFGPGESDLQVVGLLEMGKQVILESVMYPDI